MQKIICFDVGGTKISQAVLEIDFDKKAYTFLDYQNEKNPVDTAAVKDIFLKYARQKNQQFDIDKVAVSSARLVNAEEKKVYDATSYYGQEVFNFEFLLKEGFDLRVGNDGHCFSLGEYWQRLSPPASMLTLAIGTGIGGGLVVNGQIYRGAHNSALEVSHTVIEKDGALCGCGQHGCWAMYGAGSGIERQYKKMTGQDRRAEEIFELSKNNASAKAVIESAGDYLSLGLINLLNTFDPELVVLGGSLSNQEGFIQRVVEQAQKQAFNKKADYRFEISTLKDKSNLLGAAYLWKK